MLVNRKKFRPARVLVISFFSIIILGTVTLMFQGAVNGPPLTFIDALFTSTSATCVTGLIVVDTGTKFTFWGQFIILLLIQIGGLGIMTLSTFFVFLAVGHFTIFDRDIIQETLTQKPIKNLASLLKITFVFTITVELIGALVLTIRFLKWYPLQKASYYGIFHSVSAFCNAGFALFSNSFVDFKSDFIINFTLMSLIILGGLGFIVLLDVKQFFEKKVGKLGMKISLHSKLVLLSSAVLIVFGALNIFIMEYKNILSDFPLETKIYVSFFQSVTPRTAGFNTVDISTLSNVSLFLIILLMFIGASPGSCGGGIKTTSFATLVAFLKARFKNQGEVNIFYRRIPQEILSRVISITFFSMSVIIIFTMLLMITEIGEVSHQQARGMFLDILFEVVSAFGTVGLSTGVTPTLTMMGKFLLAIVMFIGRLGPLTIALAIGSKESSNYKYVQEHFLVG